MGTRLATAVLLALLCILHAQLWFGRGSVPSVAQLQRELDEQKARNEQAVRANEQLAAEVRDLKEGLEMVEEKARLELGMVRQGEIFVQVATGSAGASGAAPIAPQGQPPAPRASGAAPAEAPRATGPASPASRPAPQR